MKKLALTYRMTVTIPLISPFIIDSYLGFRRVLSVFKRLRAEVDKNVLYRCKRFVKDKNIDNHGFMEFDTDAPIGELRM